MGLESYPVFTRKVLTDLNYLACARKLISHTDVIYPQFATHNALTATSVQEIARDHSYGPYTDFEFQRLHGMGDQLHDTLLRDGARSRIYAPVGGHRELLPYLVRRLLENGANSSFVNQLIDPDLAVEEIVTSPFDIVSELTMIPNPAIPSPRDLFTMEARTSPQTRRLSARGLDLTDPLTAARFGSEALARLDPVRAIPILADSHPNNATPRAVINPARPSEHIGTVLDARAEDVDIAIKAARAAQPDWAHRHVADRASILRRFADVLEADTDRFMALCVGEAGKTWDDGLAEVREAVDFCRYYAQQAEALDDRDPLGLVGCISPWNFPLAIFLGQITASLAAGNAVIAKPAEQTPLIAYEAIRLLHSCGVPTEICQFLPGPGETVGAAISTHGEIDGIVFTGSTPVARSINRALNKKKPFPSGETPPALRQLIAETGGINAMIIDSTALLEQAVTDCVDSAFQSAGQRCSACRIVCVQRDIAERFCEMLSGAMKELSVGDPALLSTDVGPVIDREASDGISAYIEAQRQVWRVIAEAERPDNNDATFVAPIAFDVPSVADVTQEIFGPVLHIVRYDANSLPDIVQAVNASGFGLTMGIHTRIDETMHNIVDRARVGNIYVNRNQIGAVVGVQPFGGERCSGTGPKAGGPHYLLALTRKPQNDRNPEKTADIDVLSISAPERPVRHPLIDHAQAAYDRCDSNQYLPKIVDLASGIGPDATAEKAFFNRFTAVFADHFGHVETLPGPTGESNTLRLKGRGIILCLGDAMIHPTDDALLRQIATAVAAGNVALAPDTAATATVRSRMSSIPSMNGILTLFPAGPVEASMLFDPRLNGVAFDGHSLDVRSLRAVLAQRETSIVPVLSSDDPTSFAVERTVTINTTAAGGDVRLLSLES